MADETGELARRTADAGGSVEGVPKLAQRQDKGFASTATLVAGSDRVVGAALHQRYFTYAGPGLHEAEAAG